MIDPDKQLKSLSAIVGRTVDYVKSDSDSSPRHIGIYFTDGTYLAGIADDYVLSINLFLQNTDIYFRLDAGLITKEEFDAIKVEQEESRKKQTEQYEREQLAKLKAKYEGSNEPGK